MRSQPRVWLVLIGIVAIAASLVACTTPAVKTSKTPLPTPTPGTLQLMVDRSVYTSTQPIGITVTNTTKTVYYAVTGRSACTFLQLQEYNQKQRAWVSVYGCGSVDTPVVRRIPPSVSTPYTLAPGTVPASSPNVWEAGIYRVALQYSTESDGATNPQVAYSQGFQIKG